MLKIACLWRLLTLIWSGGDSQFVCFTEILVRLWNSFLEFLNRLYRAVIARRKRNWRFGLMTMYDRLGAQLILGC
jgi:hypothetical protein